VSSSVAKGTNCASQIRRTRYQWFRKLFLKFQELLEELSVRGKNIHVYSM